MAPKKPPKPPKTGRKSAPKARKGPKTAPAKLRTGAEPAQVAPKPTPGVITGAILLQTARRTVFEALQGVQANLEHVERQLQAKRDAGEYDTSLGSHHAWVTQKAVSLLGEVRKLEAHDRRAGEEMTPEEELALLKEHIRELSVDQRAGIRALLDELDEGGVL